MKQLFLTLTLMVAGIGMSAQIMYKVTGPGVKGASYLFGTHHLAPIAVLDSIASFNSALDQVDAVFGEVEMSEMNSPETQQYMMTLCKAPADSTLSKVLNPAQIDSLNTVLNKYTMGMANAAAFEQMTPAIVGTQLALLQAMREFPDFNPQKQLDITIQQMAMEKGKPNGGLETAKSQLDILFGQPISVQANTLVETVRNDQRMAQIAKDMATAYLNRDLDRLLEIMFSEPGTTPAELDRVIFNRNRNWVERMRPVMADKSVMFVVGAGHLPSDDGLIALLRKAGYTVEPMN